MFWAIIEFQKFVLSFVNMTKNMGQFMKTKKLYISVEDVIIYIYTED